MVLTDQTPEEQRALADLHGWRELPGPRVRIRLSKLDQALRESKLGVGLEEVSAALGGPLRFRHTERRQALEQRERQWQSARDQVRGRQELESWLGELRSLGLLARAARGKDLPEEVLLNQALAVLNELPASGTMLAVLASRVCGDAHALDPGTALSGLVLRGAAALAGWPEGPRGSSERRRLWEEMGVCCDPLSTDVLTLGLRPGGTSRLERHLRESSEEGEPRRITLRELTRSTLERLEDRHVYVCENPSIVAAAADHHGSRSAAVVCVEGVPSTASLLLLRQLAATSAELHFHADFDWGGVIIGNILISQFPSALPWRFGATDYVQAVESGKLHLDLHGAPRATPWDHALKEKMIARGTVIHEEQVLEDLLADLARGP